MLQTSHFIGTLTGVLLVAAAATAPLNPQTIERIESKLVLPPGSYRLASYCRHYALKLENGRRVVQGYFEFGEIISCASRVSIAEDLPLGQIQDGGCIAIHLTYDLDADLLLGIYCNGVA
jgi:hypothetical protein